MTEEEFLTAQSMGLLSMDWEYHSSTLFDKPEVYENGLWWKWSIVCIQIQRGWELDTRGAH